MHDFALENNINIAQYIYLKYLFLDFFLIEDGFQACLPFQVSLLEVFKIDTTFLLIPSRAYR